MFYELVANQSLLRNTTPDKIIDYPKIFGLKTSVIYNMIDLDEVNSLGQWVYCSIYFYNPVGLPNVLLQNTRF